MRRDAAMCVSATVVPCGQDETSSIFLVLLSMVIMTVSPRAWEAVGWRGAPWTTCLPLVKSANLLLFRPLEWATVDEHVTGNPCLHFTVTLLLPFCLCYEHRHSHFEEDSYGVNLEWRGLYPAQSRIGSQVGSGPKQDKEGPLLSGV